MSTNRVLPMPTSSGSCQSSMNVASSQNTPYLRDMDMTAASNLSLMLEGREDDDNDDNEEEEGEESTGIYPSAIRPYKSLSSMARAERFSHAFSDGVASPHHHQGQNYMLRYTPITEDGSLDTLPITTASSSVFTRSGTTDSSSDIEEPLMMSMPSGRRQEPQQ